MASKYTPAPAHAQRVDLAGATLLPGFNDAHVHIWKLGLLLTVQVDARGDAAPTIRAIIDAFQARAAVTPHATISIWRRQNTRSR